MAPELTISFSRALSICLFVESAWVLFSQLNLEPLRLLRCVRDACCTMLHFVWLVTIVQFSGLYL